MTQDEAAKRVLAKISLPPGTAAPVGFLLEIIVVAAISFLAQKFFACLWPATAKNPGIIGTWRLNRAIRHGCDEAANRPEADQLHLDGSDLYAAHGAEIREAILAVGREATPGEWVRFRASLPKPIK